MTHVPIPAWTPAGLLPPVGPDLTDPHRSPYQVSLSAAVERFATSPARARILDGLLRYRAGLHRIGLTVGFQWLDGSFVEDVETREGRVPNDLDVVTFYQRPAGVDQARLRAVAPGLFDTAAVRVSHHLDVYGVDLALPPAVIVQRATYWYSMWSHRSDLAWKGYIEVDLRADDDAAAAILVNRGQVAP